MQYKDATLKNIHTLPLAGIAFHRFGMDSSQYDSRLELKNER